MHTMLSVREEQRLNRTLKSIHDLQSGTVSFQQGAANLKKKWREKLTYVASEIFFTKLVIETDFDIGLYPKQAVAIDALSIERSTEPVECLFELPMGCGKTAVVTPVTLSLLADGDTLPILVMPEQLIPEAASQLQERMNKAVGREVRTYPIDRTEHTVSVAG